MSVISSQLSLVSQRGDDFNSDAIVLNYELDINDSIIDRCATALSHNEMITKREASAKSGEHLRVLAMQKAM